MEKFNLKSIIVALIILIIGILLIPIDIYCLKTDSKLWISIGCSLIASSLVIILTELLVERKKSNPLDKWNISKIYSTRAEKNADSDPNLDKAHYCVDIVAFGLSSFRSKYSKKVETCLRKGVNFRILTMNPGSQYVSAREREEKEVEGNTKKSINDLIVWADNFNAKGFKGKIIVKGYNCMTLDFYWRVDNTLYIGPYWYGYKSVDTITYCYLKGGKGFSQYTEYFNSLWEDKEITTFLSKEKQIKPRKKIKY